jgi:tetratricopeptide (TPR) repeat protein
MIRRDWLACALFVLLAGAAALQGGVKPEVSAGLYFALAAMGGVAAATRCFAPIPAGGLSLALAGCGLGLASALWSVAPDATLDACAALLASALIFLLCAGTFSAFQARRFLGGFAVLGAVIACVALARTPLGARAREPFGNPNHLAAWLLLPASYAFARLVGSELARRGRREDALLWFGIFGLLGAGVAATESLGALLAALGVCAATIALQRLPARLGTWLVIGAWSAVALWLACVPALLPGLLQPSGREGELSTGLRWQVYSSAGHAAWSYLPLGAGLGAFAPAFTRSRPMGLPYAVLHAHSEPLQAWVELGLPGLLLGIVAVRRVGARLIRLRTQSALAIAPAAGLIAVVCHSLVDFPLHVPAVALATGALAGIAWAGNLGEVRESRRSQPRSTASALTRRSVAAVALLLALVAGSQGVALFAEGRAARRFAQGEFALAERDARRGLWVRPGRPALLTAAADAAEAEFLLGGGGAPFQARALRLREETHWASPLDAAPVAALARTRAASGDSTGALAAATESAWLDPASPAPWLGLAQLWLDAGRGAEAADAVHEALERFPRTADETLTALLRATRDPLLVRVAAPESAYTRRSAGLVLARAGFFRAAADELVRAAELAPGDADTVLAAAHSLEEAGQRGAASDLLARALERIPGDARLSVELARLRGQDGSARAETPSPGQPS